MLMFYLKETPFKMSLRDTIKMNVSLDPDQTRFFVRPDLCPNCLQRVSTDDKKSSLSGHIYCKPRT